MKLALYFIKISHFNVEMITQNVKCSRYDVIAAYYIQLECNRNGAIYTHETFGAPPADQWRTTEHQLCRI